MGSNLWTENFCCYELTQIMRQQGDLTFAEALNRIRKGVIHESDMQMISSRETKINLRQESLPQILCPNNALVDHYNKELFEKCTEEKCSIECKDAILGNVLEKDMASIFNKISSDPKRTASLSKVVDVGVGLTYDIILNIDVKDGLANGTTGQVKRIEYKEG